MKKHHIVILAATWRPLPVDSNLIGSLPPVEAPGNYKDPEKIRNYIADATEKRNASLSDLWPLKKFESLHIRYYGSDTAQQEGDKPALAIEIESFTPENEEELTGFLTQLCDRLDVARDNHEEVQFLGVAVRDILRLLAVQFGPLGLAPLPYPLIADQREVIDPIKLFSTEKTKALEPLLVLRQAGIELPEQYTPGKSCRNDSLVAARFYNTLCRNRAQQTLTI